MNQVKMLSIKTLPNGHWLMGGYINGKRVMIEKIQVERGAKRGEVLRELEAIRVRLRGD